MAGLISAGPARAMSAAAPAVARLHAGYVLLGVLLAVPVSYPDVPYYWAAFAAFGIALLITPFERFNRAPEMVLGVIGLCMVAVISNLFSPYGYVRQPDRFLITSSFYVFFLFGLLAWEREREVMAGLAAAILLQAIAVLLAAVVQFQWSRGLTNWSQPELRLWGVGWFPDWPNFYAILLSTGFLVFLLHYRRPLPAAVCMLAAVLTTSRSVLVALAIGLAWLVLFGPRAHRALRFAVVAVLVGLGGATLALVLAGSAGLADFIDRMSLLSDREEIWRSSLELFLEHPVFGVGGVMLDESVGHTGHASFHNSYAEVLVRHGIVGFALYAWLLLAYARRVRPGHAGSAILLFFLVTAVFQNTLRHPHFFMMFSFFAVAALPRENEQ